MPDSRQPDRKRGVFETLLVVNGEPVEPEAHLVRLARSLVQVYSQVLPRTVEAELRRAAADFELGRVRLTLAPAEDGLRTDLLAGGVDAETVFPDRGVNLHSHPVAGGLGPHKWADRKGINRPAPERPGALVVDRGEVLEAGWANVFTVRNGALFTPPLDGRLLPGTTRAVVLKLASEQGIEAREEPLSTKDLLTAEETFLTGSIRGIEAADELDGQPLSGGGEISHSLAAALRRRWNLADDVIGRTDAASARKLGQLSPQSCGNAPRTAPLRRVAR